MDVAGEGGFHEEKQECVAIPLEQEVDQTESSPPVLPSRFLCPSNLGALLESTTVSLVSGGRKEYSDCRRDGKDSQELYKVDNSEERSVGRLSDVAEGCAMEVGSAMSLQGVIKSESTCNPQELQVALHCDSTPDETEFPHPEISQLLPPPIQPYTITTPLPHFSPLSIPRATLGESHRQCFSSEVDLHRHHQLCISIDEETPVKYTPSYFRNQSCGSQRSSMYSSSANEDVPGIVRHEYKTHSRNVSETPSLPPFHSSSTSSAYHSRNSSLGSQLSSCFESDSMLNQLTDIDSCIAMQSDSHTDLKHTRTRFSRKGDSSPSSYSSDLSLHRYMSKPLDRKETVCNVSPMNLEDTLRNLSLEKLDECRRNVSMKSSEWIKRQLETHRDSLVIVKVSSKTKHVVHFNVKAGDVIIWEFATKKKDIAFGVFFEATEVATEQFPVPDSHESLNDKMSSILPIFRVNTHAHPTVGTHTASLDGIYEIIFDNTYSRFFAKELYYRIMTQHSQPNANYFEQ